MTSIDIDSMFAYISIIRPVNCIMAALAVYIATIVAGADFYPSDLVIYGMAAVFLICGAGMVINDYFDIEADRVNRPNRPLPSGRIKKNNAMIYSIILFAIGIILAYMINTYCFYLAIFASLLLAIYPVFLKKIILVGHLSVSLLVALAFVFGGFIEMNYQPVILLAVLAFLSNTGREIYKSIEDVLGDKTMRTETIPMKFGVIKAKAIASAFIIAAIAFSFVPFLLGLFGYVYLFFVIFADIVFLVAILLPTRFSSKACKIAMIIALIAFLAGGFR
jgi:geranylgeranylglycerol-phosphate geranylgeranyltransferase